VQTLIWRRRFEAPVRTRKGGPSEAFWTENGNVFGARKAGKAGGLLLPGGPLLARGLFPAGCPLLARGPLLLEAVW